MLDAMLRDMLGVMLHASWYKSSTSRFMTLIMLHVLLLGMLHVACDVSFHEALGFIFHASCHVASWYDYCHAFVLHSMRLSKLSWMSGVDQR